MKSSCVPSIANARPHNFIDLANVSLDMSCQDDNRSSTFRILEAYYGLFRINTLLEEEPLLEGRLIQGTFIETNQKKGHLKESLRYSIDNLSFGLADSTSFVYYWDRNNILAVHTDLCTSYAESCLFDLIKYA